jgi:activator of 2-hydroxyglutaryl-CoA dehydratase
MFSPGCADPVVFTGGVALLEGMAAALENALARRITAAADPQMSAALGAALIAVEKCAGKPPAAGRAP